MSAPLLPLSFRPRDLPLVPRAVAAQGDVAAALGERLLEGDDAALARLAGVAGRGILVAVGEAEALPWVDGVIYLGRDPGAPSLFVPTALEPTVPMPLLERAVLARAPTAAIPLAILCDPRSLAPTAIAAIGDARPLQRDRIRRFLDEERGAIKGARP